MVRKVRDSAARKLNRGRKRKLCSGGGGGKAGPGFESWQAWFFFKAFFSHSIVMIFSEDQLFLHAAVQQKSLLFCLSNLLLFDVLHLLFIRQYMVMTGCTQKQCMRVFFFVALWLLGFAHFKPLSRLVKFSRDEPNLVS